MPTTRPEAIVVGELRARAIRPPSREGGAWYWRAEVYEDGGSRTVWTGRGERADVLARLVELRAAGGHRPADTDERTIDNVALLLGYWVAAVKRRGDLEEASKTSYAGHAKAVKAVLGHVRLDRVSKATLEAYRDQALARGRGTSSVRQDLRILRMAWRWGYEVGACDEERLPPVRLNLVPVRSRYTPTPGDAAAMLVAMQARIERYGSGDWPLWVVRIQWATGMRIGEVAALRVRDLNLAARRVEVVRSKTHKVRQVAIRQEFADELAELVAGRHPDARLWPVSPFTVRVRVNKLLDELAEEAKVPHWTSHGFRRSAVTRWLDAGGGLKAGSAQFGHSVDTMLRTYHALTESSLELNAELAALDKLPEGQLVELDTARSEGA